MYLDISSNQGAINWKTVKEKHSDIKGVILRATTKNNQLDVRTKENYEAILHNMSDIDEISVYKFSYAYNYTVARMEAKKCLQTLYKAGVHFDHFYLDLEKGTKDYTPDEASAVIMAYKDELKNWDYPDRFGIYCNYNYLKNIIDPYWYKERIWLARYNNTMGDTFGANVKLWQYTSKGRIQGISTNVDLSKEV